jgi:hypothetical protein
MKQKEQENVHMSRMETAALIEARSDRSYLVSSLRELAQQVRPQWINRSLPLVFSNQPI